MGVCTPKGSRLPVEISCGEKLSLNTKLARQNGWIPLTRSLLVLAVSLSMSCGGTNSALRTKAARDLDCPEQQIKIRRVDDSAVAEGCGLSAPYERTCNFFNCSWALFWPR